MSFRTVLSAEQWWHTPFILALGKQRQEDLRVRCQPGVHSKFPDIHSYTEKHHLKKNKQNCVFSAVITHWLVSSKKTRVSITFFLLGDQVFSLVSLGSSVLCCFCLGRRSLSHSCPHTLSPCPWLSLSGFYLWDHLVNSPRSGPQLSMWLLLLLMSPEFIRTC